MFLEIRYIRPDDDLLAVSNIYEQSWKYAYRGIIPQDYLDSIPAGRWADGIRRAGMMNLVLLENGMMIGTASICKSRWEQYPDYGEIVSIYLLPEYIGQGYGKYLINGCTEELRKLGFDKILLWVLEKNTRARHFYEKCGLICAAEYREDCIGGKVLREVMYIYTCTQTG